MSLLDDYCMRRRVRSFTARLAFRDMQEALVPHPHINHESYLARVTALLPHQRRRLTEASVE